jgi:hypothetical protein
MRAHIHSGALDRVRMRGDRRCLVTPHIGSGRAHLIEWLRLPGDLVFIIFGAIPLVIASIKGYLDVRTHGALVAARSARKTST